MNFNSALFIFLITVASLSIFLFFELCIRIYLFFNAINNFLRWLRTLTCKFRRTLLVFFLLPDEKS